VRGDSWRANRARGRQGGQLLSPAAAGEAHGCCWRLEDVGGTRASSQSDPGATPAPTRLISMACYQSPGQRGHCDRPLRLTGTPQRIFAGRGANCSRPGQALPRAGRRCRDCEATDRPVHFTAVGHPLPCRPTPGHASVAVLPTERLEHRHNAGQRGGIDGIIAGRELRGRRRNGWLISGRGAAGTGMDGEGCLWRGTARTVCRGWPGMRAAIPR